MTFLVVRTLHKTVFKGLTKVGDIIERLERLESPLTVLTLGVLEVSGIRLGSRWKLWTLDKTFGFLSAFLGMICGCLIPDST